MPDFSDNFTGSGALGSNWNIFSGTWTKNGYATESSAGTPVVAVHDFGSNNCDISVTISVLNVLNGIAFRAKDAGHFWSFSIGSSTGMSLLKWTSNTPTGFSIIASDATNGVSGDVLRVVTSGSSIKCYRNGSLIFDVTDITYFAYSNFGLYAYASVNPQYTSFSGTAHAATNKFAFVADGDSRIYGAGLSAGQDPASQLEPLIPGRLILNVSVPGETVATMVANAAANVDPLLTYGDGFTYSTVLMLGGINSIYNGETAVSVYAQIKQYHDERHSAGWAKTVGGSIFTAVTITGAALTQLNLLNSMLQADHSFMDYWDDEAADPLFSDYTNTTIFQSDQIHETAVGAGYMAAGFALPMNLPPTPTGVALDIGGSAIQVLWNDPSDNSISHDIYRGQQSDHSDSTLLTNVAGGTDFYNDTGTTTGRHYYYRVRAVNSAGNSAFVDVDGISQGPIPDTITATVALQSQQPILSISLKAPRVSTAALVSQQPVLSISLKAPRVSTATLVSQQPTLAISLKAPRIIHVSLVSQRATIHIRGKINPNSGRPYQTSNNFYRGYTGVING